MWYFLLISWTTLLKTIPKAYGLCKLQVMETVAAAETCNGRGIQLSTDWGQISLGVCTSETG